MIEWITFKVETLPALLTILDPNFGPRKLRSLGLFPASIKQWGKILLSVAQHSFVFV